MLRIVFLRALFTLSVILICEGQRIPRSFHYLQDMFVTNLQRGNIVPSSIAEDFSQKIHVCPGHEKHEEMIRANESVPTFNVTGTKPPGTNAYEDILLKVHFCPGHEAHEEMKTRSKKVPTFILTAVEPQFNVSTESPTLDENLSNFSTTESSAMSTLPSVSTTEPNLLPTTEPPSMSTTEPTVKTTMEDPKDVRASTETILPTTEMTPNVTVAMVESSTLLATESTVSSTLSPTLNASTVVLTDSSTLSPTEPSFNTSTVVQTESSTLSPTEPSFNTSTVVQTESSTLSPTEPSFNTSTVVQTDSSTLSPTVPPFNTSTVVQTESSTWTPTKPSQEADPTTEFMSNVTTIGTTSSTESTREPELISTSTASSQEPTLSSSNSTTTLIPSTTVPSMESTFETVLVPSAAISTTTTVSTNFSTNESTTVSPTVELLPTSNGSEALSTVETPTEPSDSPMESRLFFAKELTTTVWSLMESRAMFPMEVPDSTTKPAEEPIVSTTSESPTSMEPEIILAHGSTTLPAENRYVLLDEFENATTEPIRDTTSEFTTTSPVSSSTLSPDLLLSILTKPSTVSTTPSVLTIAATPSTTVSPTEDTSSFSRQWISTTEPTAKFSTEPTAYFTTEPTTNFTTEPTANFSTEPTANFSTEPTANFSTEPTANFSTEPTANFTTEPTSNFSTEPTSNFSTEPTANFTTEPTANFSTEPTPYFSTETTANFTTEPTADSSTESLTTTMTSTTEATFSFAKEIPITGTPMSTETTESPAISTSTTADLPPVSNVEPLWPSEIQTQNTKSIVQEEHGGIAARYLNINPPRCVKSSPSNLYLCCPSEDDPENPLYILHEFQSHYFHRCVNGLVHTFSCETRQVFNWHLKKCELPTQYIDPNASAIIRWQQFLAAGGKPY